LLFDSAFVTLFYLLFVTTGERAPRAAWDYSYPERQMARQKV
jgi:uncharacterized protein (DUF427 family)